MELKVRGVRGEQKRGENSSLWGPCAADHSIRHTVLQSDILRTTRQIVCDPGNQRGVHLHRRQLTPQQGRLDGVERTGKIQKHDSHSASWFVQVGTGTVEQEDDGVLYSKSRLVEKLKRIQ